jgi:hypothetical protein
MFSNSYPIQHFSMLEGFGSFAERRRLADNFDCWTSAVEESLQEARNRLPADTDLTTLSKLVLSVMEGAVMQSRARRSIEPFDASVGHLRNYFSLLVSQREADLFGRTNIEIRKKEKRR